MYAAPGHWVPFPGNRRVAARSISSVPTGQGERKMLPGLPARDGAGLPCRWRGGLFACIEVVAPVHTSCVQELKSSCVWRLSRYTRFSVCTWG